MKRRRRTTLEIAKPQIIDFFANAAEKIYTTKDLENILISNREAWRVAESASVSTFIEFLIAETNIQNLKLNFLLAGLRNFQDIYGERFQLLTYFRP